MNGDLVQTRTVDKVVLHGFYRAMPAGQTVVVYVHDLFGAFYTSPWLPTLANALAAQQVGLLTVNTRGHDGASAYETLEAARQDLVAWLDWLATAGITRVILMGQGYGATKVADYMADMRDDRVKGGILVAPPDGASLKHSLGQPLDEALAWALLMLEAGQAEELIRLEGLGIFSARTIRDLFGLRGALYRFNYSDRNHDWRWWGQINTPTLVVEVNADAERHRAAERTALLKRHWRSAQSLTTNSVETMDELIKAVTDWLAGL